MRKLVSGILTLLVMLGIISPASATTVVGPRQTNVTNGIVQIDTTPFPGIGNNWDFTLTKIGGFKAGDWVDFSLIDSLGKELDSDFEYLSATAVAPSAIKFTLVVYSGLTPQAVSAGITARVEIDPTDWQAPSAKYDLRLAPNTFPSAPNRTEDYVKFSNSSYKFEKRSGCAYQAVDLTISDPYSEVSSVEVSLQTATGEEIAEDRVIIDRTLGINFASLFLCSDDFQTHSGTQKLVLTVEWNGSARAPFSATVPGILTPVSATAMSAISKLKNFCVKGTAFKSRDGIRCPNGFKLATFREPTVIQWNSLSRNASASTRANFRIFACISQFDSVTGPSSFRGYSSRTESSSYFAETNSYFRGDSKLLLPYGEDDAIVANVTVLGKYSYSTFGGQTSVPEFQIRDLKKVGTC